MVAIPVAAMRHSKALIKAVERAVGDAMSGSASLSFCGIAIVALDALRAAEDEEMKTDRQALVDAVLGGLLPTTENTEPAEAIASDILSDFHVSMREDVTEPIRKPADDREARQRRAYETIAALQTSGKPLVIEGDEFHVDDVIRTRSYDHGQVASDTTTVILTRIVTTPKG